MAQMHGLNKTVRVAQKAGNWTSVTGRGFVRPWAGIFPVMFTLLFGCSNSFPNFLPVMLSETH